MRSLAFAATLLGVAAGTSASAAECGALAALKIDDVNVLSATEVLAAGDLPTYCRVLGYVRPAINFEIRLPDAASWNGKFYMTGCGGFCGKLLSDAPGFTNAMNFGLRRNYAVATMDSGHWGANVVDGRWALANPVAEADWGRRAVTETARAAKSVIKALYETAERRSYFAGCSTGGRMAAMEAASFPEDFDGVISGAPALDYTGLVATFFAWAAQANVGPDGKPILTPARLPLFQKIALEACDSLDGAADGMIEDPRQCRLDPSARQCSAGSGETASCLTEAEAGALRKWYDGPKDSRGRQLYPGGVPPGSEVHWPRWLVGTQTAPPALPAFATNFLQYMAFQPDPGPSYRISDFDFDHDPRRLSEMAKVYNVTTFDPNRPNALPGADFSAFRERGGKLLFYHGWADPLVTPYLTVAFYDAIAKASGGMDEARDFSRLFMIPGMDHCGVQTGGPGISDLGIDPLTALERWVEEGVAPDVLTATKTDASGAVQWRRPVCAWPRVARRNDGRRFECVDP